MKVFHHYDIAYRKKGEKNFKIVKPPKYGWVADPFLVEYKNEVYLFAEIFLYKSERNGVIGYCKYDGDGFGDWIVTMDKHWHLSYPNVFVENGKLYMVPESYQLGEVVLYELQEFPAKWKKLHSYIADVEYVDSTFLDYKDGNRYMFTFERGNKSPEGTGILYRIDNGKLMNKIVLSNSLEGSRCGGKIIEKDGKYIRVGQNCVREYGGGLIFYEIDSISPVYKEHELCRVEPTDIPGDFDKVYTGVHTYNVCNDIEVIDLRYPSSTKEENEASNRVHGVFVNKYE